MAFSSAMRGAMEPGKLKLISGYVDRGWLLVPIPSRAKAPAGSGSKGWQKKRITDPQAIGDGNVGILLGEPSSWLIDIDLDWIEAAELADEFLPETPAVFGRPGKPRSHWLYTVEGAKTKTWQHGKKDEGGMIVELRSTGHQTVFPPSIHPSGETIAWDSFETPAPIAYDPLAKACGTLAAAALASRNWPDGSRQDCAFGIAGMCLKAGIPDVDVEHFIEVVATHAGDTEVEKRVAAVQRTGKGITEGIEVIGYSGLVEIWGKDIPDRLARFLGISAEEDIPSDAILISNRPSKELAAEAWARLVEQDMDSPALFTFGESIARIDNAVSEVLVGDGFWQELASRLNWVRRENKRVYFTDPPPGAVKYMVHQRKAEIPLPSLAGVTSTPIMAANGSVHDSPGYDSASRFYLSPSCVVPAVSPSPKPKERERALRLLMETIHDFPFAHESDRAHALGMIILPFVRPMITGPTPLHLLDKPVQGTGATLLAESATLIKTGTALAAAPAPRNEEEWQKVILSKLLTAPEFIFLDNVRTIYSDSLAVALTTGVYEGRRLGVSEMLRLPVGCTWIMTGNNVDMGPDFKRRTIHIRLDAKVEDPTMRIGFMHPDLHEWIRETRGELVWAILTLARAWVSARRPAPKLTRASFNSWALVVGGILERAGVSGFLETPDERAKNIDPLRDVEQEFIRAWLAHALINPARFTMRAGELLNMCESCELAFGFGNGRHDMNTMSFSKSRMARIADRVFGIATMNGERIDVRVSRDYAGGNGAWTIQIMNDAQGAKADDIWQGMMWQ